MKILYLIGSFLAMAMRGRLLQEKDLPQQPGVYRFYDEAGVLFYVGKAKNLRRRLAQYRNARRLKKHRKMRSLYRELHRLEYELCESHLLACLREVELIQKHQPRGNVQSRYFFLYPFLGFRREGTRLWIACTEEPEKFPEGFTWHGAFRSRRFARAAHFAGLTLLTHLGRHEVKASRALQRQLPRFSQVSLFGGILGEWSADWEALLEGRSDAFLEKIFWVLLEKNRARCASADIARALEDLRRFYRHEAKPLQKVRRFSPAETYPIDQARRDLLFIRYRLRGEKAVDPSLEPSP